MSLLHVAVVGPGDEPGRAVDVAAAEAVGWGLAAAGAVVVCGGLGGVMAAVCRGAAAGGGASIGLLPGNDRDAANEWVSVAIATGLGEARNALVVNAADAVIAIGGGYGTLSEIALALRAGKPVIGIDTWGLHRDGATDTGVVRVAAAPEAVATALELAANGPVDLR